ncbi:MAG: TolC family protein [Bacteroidales bacterium]|nr:TolC family protein [Bacteroidales bacterium]
MKILLKSLFLTALALLMMPQPVISQEAEPHESKNYQFTLEDCLRFAFANSYDRKSMELSAEAQQVTYEQSKQSRLPSVNASASETYSNNKNGSNYSGNVGVGASVVIYQGGNINKSIKQNRLNMERSEMQLQQYDNQLSVQILQAFLSALSNNELLEYQEVMLNSSRAQMKQGQERYKVGSILESDMLLLEAQYISDSTNVIETRISRDNSIMSLKVLLSMDPLDNLQIIQPNTDNLDDMTASLPSEEAAIDMALEAYPSLKLSQYDILLAENNISMAKTGYMPSLNANANVGTGHTDFDNVGQQFDDRFNQSIGISLSIPIYSRGQNRANVKRSKIALEQAQLDYEQTQLDVRQTVSLAYRNVISSYNTFKASEMKENAYSKSYNAYEVQFNYGKITAVELLQQQNNYLNVLNTFIRNKYTLLLQRKILDVYMGNEITL